MPMAKVMLIGIGDMGTRLEQGLLRMSIEQDADMVIR